jgi:hypothetical protein
MVLIDEFMPEPQFAERHAVRVAAPPERAWAAVRALDLRGSLLIRTLFALRSVPALFSGRVRAGGGLGSTMDSLLRGGFVLLAERPPREIVLGLTGKFWTPTGRISRVEADEFRGFNRPGLAMAAWNFTVLPTDEGSLVATETRVRCTDDAARRSFSRSWRVVRPFSGLVRTEALRVIRRTAESGADPHA